MSVAVPAPQAWNHPLPRAVYDQLAQCETEHDTTHSTPTYVSAFGMTRRVWDDYADAPASRAPHMTFAQQARVLDRVFWFGHVEHGVKKWPAGPWGHGCFKHYWKVSSKLRTAVCNNRKQSVRRWCRK